MLICATILTGLISFFVSSIFNRGIYFFLTFFSTIILNVEILSLFKKINGTNIIILTLIETICALVIWLYKKKPILKVEFKKFFKDLLKAYREDKSLIVLSLFWIFLISISFILASLSPVNEPDAQGYHALRALYWAQDGFIHHFETTDIRNLVMPINSELFYTWVFALFKQDTVVGLLQFFSYFLLIFSSFKIMEFYEIDFEKRLWAIFIFSSLAGVVSQISSTQTDLAVGSLFCATVYLILDYKNKKCLSSLFFASLALSIACGVKSTGIIGSIPLFIWFCVLLKKDFIKFFGFFILNFTVFSSYNYILNFISFNNPLGSTSSILSHCFWGGIKGFFANFIRYIFQMFDFSGFTLGFYLNPYLLKMQNAAISLFSSDSAIGQNAALDFTNISMTEQVLGFGILGFLVFLPVSIIGFFNKKLRIFSILFWAQIATLSFSIAYMIYSIRFIVSFIALAIPLLSISYFKKMRIFKFFVILFCFFYMTYASLYLSQRPFHYLKKEYQKTHDIKLIQENMRDLNYKFYPSFNEAYTMKEAIVPYCENGNKIGLLTSSGYMIYSSKYMEFSKNCKINSINILHLKNEDLSSYDILVTQKITPEGTTTINKKDIEEPFENNERAACYFWGPDKSRYIKPIAPNNIKNATEAQCRVNEKYIEFLGFKKDKYVKSEIPKYLTTRKNETVTDFIIFKKNK